MHLVELKKLFHLNFGSKSVIIKNVKGHSKSTFVVEGKGKEGGGGGSFKSERKRTGGVGGDQAYFYVRSVKKIA